VTYKEITIALEAAHVMANHFQEPVYLISDLSIKRREERRPSDRVIEKINPEMESELWARIGE